MKKIFVSNINVFDEPLPTDDLNKIEQVRPEVYQVSLIQCDNLLLIRKIAKSAVIFKPNT